MKKKLIVLLLVSLINITFAQKVLTSREAIQIALQRNTSFQKAVKNFPSYESGLQTAYGGLLPTLGAQATWNWTRSEIPGGTVNFGMIQSVGESRTYSAGVSTNWTLFDGLANMANIAQAKSNLEGAKFSIEKLKQDIVFQTLSNYYDIMNAEKLMNVKGDIECNQ